MIGYSIDSRAGRPDDVGHFTVSPQRNFPAPEFRAENGSLVWRNQAFKLDFPFGFGLQSCSTLET